MFIYSRTAKLSEIIEMLYICTVQYGSHKPHEASATKEMDL